ncbi:SRPBCC family protein [Methylobacterium sp. NEAU 140]|uniref:SRPBCC family protein n=1 Tax=Methylobacterium sp. NEAU 140 TaxID=3064945 RepID=UPI00273419A3|nr:SRPBCC family protein [Methylobacterium sp. NEAU 140]MDP4025061.1 SRPBCC family protein [Methylobacterium sp. NEAU 140]
MTDADDKRDLVIARLIPAPPRAVYRAYTEPALLKRWFAPKPYTVSEAELDVRPGGSQRIVMVGPDGTAMPLHGVYLEVVQGARLVVTDAYLRAWEPAPKPFMTVVITFEAEGEGTRYTARARHWSEADRAAHEAMGFHQGWGLCADQLAEVAAAL